MRSIFLILAFGTGLLKAQQINYRVKDQSSGASVRVLVLNAQAQPLFKTEKANFTLRPSDGDYFQLISENHFIKSLTVDWSALKGSESQVIELQALELNLKEVEIVEKGIRFWDTLLVDDFELIDDNLLVIGDDYLVFSDLEGRVKKLLNNRFSFKRLERDPRGNVFAFFQDSVIQVYQQKDKIYFYPAFRVEDYNTYISPLSAVLGEALVLRNVRPLLYPLPISPYRAGNRGKSLSHPPLHNKGVEYFMYQEGREPALFYRSVDTAAVEAAQLAFNQYYGLAAHIEKFYDEYGILDNAKRFELDILRKQYQNYFAKFIPFPIVSRFGSVWVFDHIKGVVQEIDKESLALGRSIPFAYPSKLQPTLIIENKSASSFYLIEEKRGMVSIYAILEDWSLAPRQEVGLFATELKASQNKLFYISDKNYLISKTLKE